MMTALFRLRNNCHQFGISNCFFGDRLSIEVFEILEVFSLNLGVDLLPLHLLLPLHVGHQLIFLVHFNRKDVGAARIIRIYIHFGKPCSLFTHL